MGWYAVAVGCEFFTLLTVFDIFARPTALGFQLLQPVSWPRHQCSLVRPPDRCRLLVNDVSGYLLSRASIRRIYCPWNRSMTTANIISHTKMIPAMEASSPNTTAAPIRFPSAVRQPPWWLPWLWWWAHPGRRPLNRGRPSFLLVEHLLNWNVNISN